MNNINYFAELFKGGLSEIEWGKIENDSQKYLYFIPHTFRFTIYSILKSMTTPAKLAKKGKELYLARMKKKAEVQNTQPETIYSVNHRRFAISVLCCGLNPLQGIVFMLMNDVNPPSPSTFYRIQRTFINPLYELAWERILFWRNQMKDQSNLSFDGMWSHTRNAKQCIVTAVENTNQKLVDFQIVQKYHVGVNANYSGPSNLMESYGLMKIAKRWSNSTLVTSYTHDNDGKCRKILETFTNFEEKIDGGHSIKSVYSKFNKINIKYKHILSPYSQSLFKFLRFLQGSDFSLDLRTTYWLNTVNHYKGNHSLCLHDSNYEIKETIPENAIAPLFEFLWETIKFLEVDTRHSTQINESINALIAKKSRKDTCYGVGWEARVYISIIIYNDPDQWQKLIFDKLHIEPLSTEIQTRFDSIQKDKIKQNTSRKNPEYRHAEAKRRFDKKEQKETPIIDPEFSYKERVQYKPTKKQKQKPPSLSVFSRKEIEQLMTNKKILDNQIIGQQTQLNLSVVEGALNDILSFARKKVASWSRKFDITWDMLLNQGIDLFSTPPAVQIIYKLSCYYTALYTKISKKKTPLDVTEEKSNIKTSRQDLAAVLYQDHLRFDDEKLINNLATFADSIIKTDIIDPNESQIASDILFNGPFYEWAIKELLLHIRTTLRRMTKFICLIPREHAKHSPLIYVYLDYINLINSFFEGHTFSKIEFYISYQNQSTKIITCFMNQAKCNFHYKEKSRFVEELNSSCNPIDDSDNDDKIEDADESDEYDEEFLAPAVM